MGRQHDGSNTLFMCVKFLNVVFGFAALALIGLSIWLWRQFKTFTILEILFMGVGIFQFLSVLLVFTAKRSVFRLRCYLFFMLILFVLQLTSIIVSFATGDKVIKQIAHDSEEQIEELKKYLNIVIYYCIGNITIMAMMMISSYCYIKTLKERNYDYDYKFLDEDGNKITLQEKRVMDREKIGEKYEQKRRQLQQKYPKYREYRQNNQ